MLFRTDDNNNNLREKNKRVIFPIIIHQDIKQVHLHLYIEQFVLEQVKKKQVPGLEYK